MADASSSACDDTRSRLIARADGAEVDDAAVSEHLDSCSDCRAYDRILWQMQSALASDAPDLPRPDPALLPFLRAQVRARRPAWRPWQVLRRALLIRVPAYQVVVGAAAAAVLLLGPVGRVPGGPDASPHQPATEARDIPPLVLARLDSYGVVRRMQSGGHPDGPGADTLLSRHLSRYVRSAVQPSAAMYRDQAFRSSQSGPPTGPNRL